MKSAKVIFLNLIILIFLIILIEIFFGSWFKKNNFGYSVRDIRNIKIPMSVKFEGKKYEYFFKRNNYGFIGENIKPENIEILFLGGSTGEEMFKPREYSIVEKLNNKLSKDNINLKIINASKGGKSTRGYVNDLRYWFPKIENFNPKFLIFYTGINDASLEIPDHFDLVIKDKLIDKLEDYFKNNSIFYFLKKQIQNKYFNKIRKHYGLVKEDLYNNYDLINYNKAIKKYSNLEKNEKNLNVLSNFPQNLENLKDIITKEKFIPIFITQIGFDGLGNYNLYLVNEFLKKFCVENNYMIIKLDEMNYKLDEKDFYDNVHTTIRGSEKISNLIYSDLKKFLKNN